MTPKRFILHVGMPKTGSSSIQESLFHGLADPRFHYIGLGLVNGSRGIQCLVGDEPVAKHLHPAQGIDREAFRSRSSLFRQAWERQVERARRAGAIPVLSAEDCWFFDREEWGRLAALIAETGHRAHVIAYVRPPLAWLASMFQELLKSGHHAFVDDLLIRDGKASTAVGPFGCDYLLRLSMIEEVFGAGNLSVRAYRPEALAGGCVVEDFCRQAGIEMPGRRIRRVNESLSLDATRFLYSYNRFARRSDSRSFREFLLLLRRLGECPGPPLRLHPDLLDAVMPLVAAQLPVLQQRYGVALEEDWTRAGEGAIQCEADLWRFSPQALEWLDAASGAIAVPSAADTANPAEVAARVASLRPRFRDRWEDFLSGKRFQWRLRRAGL